MSRLFNAVTVDTTSGGTSILSYLKGRRGFIIKNNGSNIVYVGFDTSLTASTGIPILPQDSLSLTGDSDVFRGSVYGITSSGSSDVRYWDWEL